MSQKRKGTNKFVVNLKPQSTHNSTKLTVYALNNRIGLPNL